MQQTSRVSLTALFVTCLAYPALVVANTISADIERVLTVGSRLEGDTSDTGYVISSVTEKEINFVSPTHIQEVLNYVAGVGVQRGNGQEYLPSLRSPVLTGAGGCGGILSTEDNIPLRAAGFCNINELFEAHGEMAQKIEVLKGPGSALYGSNAIHGVINVITPDVTQDTHLLGLDYGSYGYHRIKLRQGTDFGNSGIGINASITRDTGYRDEEGVDQEKVNIRHRYNANEMSLTTGLTLTNLDQETAGYISGFESYKDKSLAKSNENPEAYRQARSFRLWTRAVVSLQDENALSITPYVRNQSMNFRMHYLPGTPIEKNQQEGFGVISQYHHVLSDEVSVDLGFDTEYTEGGLQQYQPNSTEGSAFLVETIPAGMQYNYDVNVTLYAPFLAFNWQSEGWNISLGGRYEYMNYDYTNNMLTGRTREDGSPCGFGGCRYSRPASRQDDFRNFSPKFSLNYKFSESLQWYTGISHGYRVPQTGELYRLQREQDVADLDAVKATNIEMGIKGQRATYGYVVSAYSLRKDNVIYRDSDYFNVNHGETWHRGIEISVNYRFSELWDVAFAGTYARHTYEHEQWSSGVNIKGNEMDTAPALIFNARIGYRLTDNAHFELEWQHVDKYYTDPENLHEYEGHDLLNARISWDITPRVSLYARVNNLLNQAYAERADYTSFSAERYFPGKPRNVMFSVTYQY